MCEPATTSDASERMFANGDDNGIVNGLSTLWMLFQWTSLDVRLVGTG